MTQSATGPSRRPTAPTDITCPRCHVAVEPSWDWCEGCGFDPEHLRPETSPGPAVDRSDPSLQTLVKAARPDRADPAAPAPPRPPGPRAAPAAAAALPRPTATPAPPSTSVAPAPRVAPRVAPAPPSPAGPTAAGAGRRITNGSTGARPDNPVGLPRLGVDDATIALEPRRPWGERARWVLIGAAGLAIIALFGFGLAVVLRQRASAPTRPVEARLLTPADLPAGWTTVPPTSPLEGSPWACLGRPPTSTGPLATKDLSASAYRSPQSVPNLFEQVERYSPGQATARWDELLGQALHGCPGSAPTAPAPAPVSASAAPTTLPVVVGPRVGDESATFSIALGDGTSITLLLARSQGTVVTLQLVDANGADPSLFDRVAASAVRRAGS